jgi:hypothetical protein
MMGGEVNATLLQIQANGPLGCFAEQLLKKPNSKHGYCLTALFSRGQVDKQYGQIISSAYSSHFIFNMGGGGLP